MTPAGGTPDQDRKSWLERTLSLVAPVRGGEGTTVFLMLVNIFLLLICYSIIKAAREPLILLGGGGEALGGGAVRAARASAGQALLLTAFVPFYAWLASRVDRVKLIVGVTLFFVVNIELFSLGVAANVPYIGVAFFIWVGVFNISLVAQFWSYANDIYSKEAGERLFPIITLGMTAGPPLGAWVSREWFEQGVTPQVIIQVSAVLLLMSLGLFLAVNRREERRTKAPAALLAASGGFQLVLGSKYLRLLAILIILLNTVNSNGEFLRRSVLTQDAAALAATDPSANVGSYVAAAGADFQLWVNIAALALQGLLTARLVKVAGFRGALLALPLVALGGYSLVALGAFGIVRWVKTAENATDYSIMNTARQLAWLPTTREEKYKAKQAIDTFFVRIGDLVSFGMVSMLPGLVGVSVGNVALSIAWIAIAMLILRRHDTLVQQMEKAA